MWKSVPLYFPTAFLLLCFVVVVMVDLALCNQEETCITISSLQVPGNNYPHKKTNHTHTHNAAFFNSTCHCTLYIGSIFSDVAVF